MLFNIGDKKNKNEMAPTETKKIKVLIGWYGIRTLSVKMLSLLLIFYVSIIIQAHHATKNSISGKFNFYPLKKHQYA